MPRLAPVTTATFPVRVREGEVISLPEVYQFDKLHGDQ
jgi:hypothetical protein